MKDKIVKRTVRQWVSETTWRAELSCGHWFPESPSEQMCTATKNTIATMEEVTCEVCTNTEREYEKARARLDEVESRRVKL